MNKTIKLIAFISTLMVVGCAETPNTQSNIPSGVPQTSTVTNTNAAVITVKSDMTININEKLHYLNLASATDEVDGNISHLMTVELPSGVTMQDGYLSFAAKGTYTITFKVVNSRNITTTNSINITVVELLSKDNHKPTILGYKTSIQVKPNVVIYPLNGVTSVDDVDGDVTSSLKATYQTLGDASEGISFSEDEGKSWTVLPEDTLVSMNFWGLSGAMMDVIGERLGEFFETKVPANPLKSEYQLPGVIDRLIREGRAQVQVIPCHEKWCGVTYKEDREDVKNELQSKKDKGLYPEKLWK